MIWHFIRNYLTPKALVLMYHRVAVQDTDIWNLSVSPNNFEEQLQVLKGSVEVIPLQELATRTKEKRRRKPLVALSFDDGYCDNYETAKPLLEKYAIPATFFVTTCNIGHTREFWWDELENLILNTPKLPATFSLTVNGLKIERDIWDENELTDAQNQKHKHWKAGIATPPTKRSELYLVLWSTLRGLKDGQIQETMQHVRHWVGAAPSPRPAFKSMTDRQLSELANHRLFDIGAHTMTHPALGFHDFDYQKKEMTANRNLLSDLTGKSASLLAYPYGHYNETTLQAAKAASFDAAFTTESSTVTKHTHFHRIGRFQVNNLNGPAFANSLKKWKVT